MFIHVVAAWCLLAGMVLLAVFALALTHYVLLRPGRRNGRRGKRCSRIPVYFMAAGLAFLQFMSELYCPSARFLLEEKCDEDADEDDFGDPESPEKQLNRQLKRIRRGEQIGDLVLRL